MAEFGIFIYAMLSSFVLVAMHRNQRLQRPNHQMVTAVGWGLFSLSTTLAAMLFALAATLALGVSPEPWTLALQGL